MNRSKTTLNFIWNVTISLPPLRGDTSYSIVWHAKFQFPTYSSFHPLQHKKIAPLRKYPPPLQINILGSNPIKIELEREKEKKRKKERKYEKSRRNKNYSQGTVDLLFRPSCSPSDMMWSGWNFASTRCTREASYVPIANRSASMEKPSRGVIWQGSS